MAGRTLLVSIYPASKLKPLTTILSLSKIRRYKHQGKSGSSEEHGIDKERAPTTAEEFERVAEEKSRQGFSSQTVDKAKDAAEEATVGSSQPQPVKKAYKESPGKGDFPKKADQR